ncbi:MAG TPA: hypothetical protein VN890_09245 [Methylocella sp.]|nr:hypothetical protein [Methylocella sp.]
MTWTTVPPESVRAPGEAIGIAEAEKLAVSASAQAANPINRKRFIRRFLHGCRVIAAQGKFQARGKFHTAGAFPKQNQINEGKSRTTDGPITADTFIVSPRGMMVNSFIHG